jgi:large repetitive protein
MRAAHVIATLATVAVAGCSLLFDGSDLKGKNGNGDMSAGGNGGGGGDDMAGGGGGGAGGGGGGAQCMPTTTLSYSVTHPATAATGSHYLAAADINGDGKLDLVTSNYGADNFSVLLGDGQGAFTLAPTTPIQTCLSPFEVIAKDVTGDGKPDVIVTCWDSTTAVVNVHVNTSTTSTVSFATAKPVTLPAQTYYFPALGKFSSGATHPGLALVGNAHIYFYNGAGDGTFAQFSAVSAGMGAQSGAVGDLNGDGVDDVIAYNYSDDDMTMALSVSPNVFAPTRLAYDNGDMGAGGLLYFAGTPQLLDYSGDGLLDIVIASGTSQTGEIYRYKNSGSATLPTFPLMATEFSVGDLPIDAVMADMNCDGKLDIVASSNGCAAAGQSCSGTPNVWVHPAAGTSFNAAITTAIDPYCDNLIVADFNNDGYPDIACGGGMGVPSSINLLIAKP